MSIEDQKTRVQHILLIAAFAIIAMLPMYFYGIPGGNDRAQHYQFAWTVYESIRSGEIYPSVAGDTNRGFGDVGLRFYPPMTYYILALAYAAIGDWFFASLLAFTLMFFAGGLGVYLWASEEFDPQTSLMAAAIYTFASYHLNLIYTSGLMAEFFAAAVLPFCFLFLTRLCRGGGWLVVLGFSTAYALLILTHLPITIITLAAVSVYALVLAGKQAIWRVIGKCVASAALALAMTAFYWARMLPELDWVKHSSQKYFETTWSYAANYLPYPSHFIAFADDALNLWLADLILLATLLIAIPSAVWLITDITSRARFVIAVVAVTIVSVFMITPLSFFVWDNISILQKVQFPWRWLSITTPFIAVLAPPGIMRGSDLLKTGGNYAIAAGLGTVLVVFVFMAAFIIKGSSYTTRAELDQQVAGTPASSGCECWWPAWSEWRAFDQKAQVDVNGRIVTVTDWGPDHKSFEIAPGNQRSATMAVFYYPHWRARVNAIEVPVEKTDDGRISLPVPAEMSKVELTFREPAYVNAAFSLSLLAWAIVICLSAALLFVARRRPVLTL